MHKGNALMSMLISLVFIMGMIAPVPECYVTRLVCPVKASHACHGLLTDFTGDPATLAPCCHDAKGRLTGETPSPCAAHGHQIKSYIPDLLNVEIPALHVVLPLNSFQIPLVTAPSHLVVHAVPRYEQFDPIPILLKKQSLLI